MNYPQLFARIFNQPQLMEPMQAEIMLGALQGRFGINLLVNNKGLELSAADIQQRASDYQGRRECEEYRTTDDGIAIISTSGSLINRGALNPMSGAMSFSSIRERMRLAAKDRSIKGILHIIDSPGGEVSGCDDTAQLIHEINKEKPVWSLAYDQMTSAAYWQGCASSRILATKTARIGSIGVLVMHADYSQHLQQEGVKVTFIHAGANKVAGNCFQPLPDSLRERIQLEVDDIYNEFTGRVAAYRNIDQSRIQQTEAGVFRSEEALSLGLIDAICPADDVLDEFTEHLSSVGRTTTLANTGEPAMTVKTKADKDDKKTVATAPEPAPAAAVAEAAAETEQTTLKADHTQAATGERQRISAIIGSEEAKGREALAQHFAFETDMAADAAVAALKVSPKAEASPVMKGSALDQAMASVDQPDIPAGGSEALSADDQAINALCAAYRN